MIKIEKNTIIPKVGKNNPSKYPFRTMEVGDSFFSETKNDCHSKGVMASSLHSSIKQMRIPGYKIITRREENGVRCWRVK